MDFFPGERLELTRLMRSRTMQVELLGAVHRKMHVMLPRYWITIIYCAMQKSS